MCVLCYKCLVNVIRVIVLNLFRYFWSIDWILEEVIVIEKLRVINRKAIRCALTLQQSQFSTISGPTLTKSFKGYIKKLWIVRKKNVTTLIHWDVLRLLSSPCDMSPRICKVLIIGGRTGLFSMMRSISSITATDKRGSNCDGKRRKFSWRSLKIYGKKVEPCNMIYFILKLFSKSIWFNVLTELFVESLLKVLVVIWW